MIVEVSDEENGGSAEGHLLLLRKRIRVRRRSRYKGDRWRRIKRQHQEKYISSFEIPIVLRKESSLFTSCPSAH